MERWPSGLRRTPERVYRETLSCQSHFPPILNEKKNSSYNWHKWARWMYLANLLLDKKYTVVGLDRFNSKQQRWRHKFLKIEKKIIYEQADLNDELSIIKIL